VAGRTPAEAVRAFLEPMESTLACLASAKITVKRGGLNPRLGVPYEWSSNNGAGAEWLFEAPEDLTFSAAMYWKLIEDDRSECGPFRVTTLGYEYSLVIGETTELWALHGASGRKIVEHRPQVHLGDVLLTEAAPVSSKTHLPTGRMTFENAIRLAADFGAVPLREDWSNRLALAETPHLLHRTWN
jgi:hypothetical protein